MTARDYITAGAPAKNFFRRAAAACPTPRRQVKFWRPVFLKANFRGLGMVWLYLLVCLLAGALMPLQAGVNAQLARWVGNPVSASLVSFAVGTLALFAYSAATRPALPAAATVASAPWWVWAGGLFGAVFVTAAAAFAPRLGAATFISITIAGQMFVSILLDQFGLVGFAARPATPLRLVGALLLVAGVLLIRKF